MKRLLASLLVLSLLALSGCIMVPVDGYDGYRRPVYREHYERRDTGYYNWRHYYPHGRRDAPCGTACNRPHYYSYP